MIDPSSLHQLYLVFYLVFGAALGSFLNAMAFRAAWRVCNKAQEQAYAVDRNRSNCPACGHELSWWENIPLLSWPILRGKCRHCSVRIPIAYWAAEVGFALLVALAWPSNWLDFVMLWPAVLFGWMVLFGIHWQHLSENNSSTPMH